tara:strand:- start:32 stop:232 length:201 start_codon:yes stop_codon:yes gene_type:complete
MQLVVAVELEKNQVEQMLMVERLVVLVLVQVAQEPLVATHQVIKVVAVVVEATMALIMVEETVVQV